VNLAGEPLRQPLVEEIFRKTSAAAVNDLYGPTETTTYSTWARRERGGVETVGRPIANTKIYLLDSQGQPVPVGITGEVCIGGAGVARGYWHRPELTADRFVPDTFNRQPGGRLFKTGDRARWLADGNLVLLGRRDGQVKLRGFRIELGEIESALRLLREVREAAVVMREHAGEPSLLAYLVPQAAEKPDPAMLRTRLAEHLPEYMLPGAFVWLERLPLTPNGKLDRRALPALQAPSQAATGAEPPATPLEQELTELWQEVFQRQDVGRHDDFFDLGGHSLLALRLTAEIEKRLDQRVPIAMLFQARTVAALAASLNEANGASFSRSLVRLQPLGSKPAVFCIHGLLGDVFGYVELARELAPDRPVFGLQAVGLEGLEPRHTTVEQMAAHYAREIRPVQPDGPYHLIGNSLGGWIAYAVAQELSGHGSKVASLSLLDTRATSHVPWQIYFRVMAPFWADRARRHFRQLLRGHEQGRLRYLKEKTNWFRVHLLRQRGRLPVRPTAQSSPPANPHELTLDYFDAVATRYRPVIYAGDVTVFAGVDAKYFNHAAFWKHFVQGRFQLIRVDGGHGSLISGQHTAKFALSYNRVLAEAEPYAHNNPQP
jgi:thioesterase domain-containing protein/acyl carrier protein